MEKWKNLMIRQFENSTMEDVYHGDTEDTKEARRCNNSIIRQFDNGRVEEWKIGRGITTETRRAQRKHEDGTIRQLDN